MHSFTLLKTWLSQLLLTKQLEYGIFQVTVLLVLVLFYGSYSLVLITLSLCTPVNWIREWQKMRNTLKVVLIFYQRQMGTCLVIPLVWSLVVKKFAGTDFTASKQSNNH